MLPKGTEIGQYWVTEGTGLRGTQDKNAEVSGYKSMQRLIDHVKDFNIFPKINVEWLKD